MNGNHVFEEQAAAPLVGTVTHLRVSPDRLKVARPVPEQFIREDNLMWLAVFFVEGVGLTVELLSDEDVKDWTVLGVDD